MTRAELQDVNAQKASTNDRSDKNYRSAEKGSQDGYNTGTLTKASRNGRNAAGSLQKAALRSRDQPRVDRRPKGAGCLRRRKNYLLSLAHKIPVVKFRNSSIRAAAVRQLDKPRAAIVRQLEERKVIIVRQLERRR